MAAEVIAAIFCAIGVFFFIVGTTGLLRLPDVFSRLHTSTKCDTLGAGSVLIGMAVYVGWSWDLFKLLAIVGFLLLSSATCGYAIANSAHKQGIRPWRKGKKEG
jgi:multicomponent Na+:H+ antiporter subunit G